MGRIQLVLEESLYDEVVERAEASGASRSLVARDLLRKALEIEEDLHLSQVAESRWKTLRRSKAVSHAAVKKKLR